MSGAPFSWVRSDARRRVDPIHRIDPAVGRAMMVDRRSQQIRRMFGEIAHRYDFLNHFLSLSIDRYWRRVVKTRLLPLLGPGAVVLDLCTGTGDLAIELSQHAQVVGCDFCHPMLTRGLAKIRDRRLDSQIRLVEGDALQLPFPDQLFDAVTVAFGLRNFEDYRAGLVEMFRVMKSPATLAILEFSQPRWPVFAHLYRFYFRRVLPRLGGVLSGREEPYSYLPQSVEDFPEPEALAEMLRGVGFSKVRSHSLTGGVATLHMAGKEP